MKSITRRDFLTLGAGVLAGGVVASALPGVELLPTTKLTRTLRFIHIADSHMDLGRPQTVTWMEKFIETVNRDFKTIDFVLAGGDNFNNNVPGNADAVRFKKMIDRLHCPVYSVRGNKESTPKPETDPVNQQQFASMFFRPDLTVVGRDWKLEKGNYVILGIDTTIEQKDNGRFSAQSLAFAEKELKGNPRKQYILLNHQVYSNFWNSTDKKDIHKYVLNNVDEVKSRLFNYPNLRLALCGHKHLDNVGRIRSTTVIATPGFVVPWGAKLDRRRFRYVEIQDDRIHEKLIDVA